MPPHEMLNFKICGGKLVINEMFSDFLLFFWLGQSKYLKFILEKCPDATSGFLDPPYETDEIPLSYSALCTGLRPSQIRAYTLILFKLCP